jgi:hypothetical protein
MAEFVQHPSGLWVPDTVVATQRAVVYCDESGNSGPNYLDAGQPFYVLAGWLIPEDRLVNVAVAIDQFRSKHFRQRDELKSSAVLRNDQTKHLCVTLFHTLGELHCVPLYLVAEKRFCVAGKIIETFLDPAYNDIVKNPFTYDVTTKQEIANTLYNLLPDDIVKQFAEAYRQPTATTLGKALREVAKTVESYVSPELAKAVTGCEIHIDEIAEVEAETSPLGDVAGTLNMPCLVSFLMLVENLGRIGMAHPIKVVHDQQHAYQEGYERIFKMHRRLPRLFARLPHSELGFSNLEHVADFEMRDSKSSPLIQAADLLAGVIHHCCRLAVHGGAVTDGDKELAAAILPGILATEPRLTWMICSERCIQQLGQRILRPAFKQLEPSLSEQDAVRRIESSLAPMFPRNQDGSTTETEKLKVDLPLFGLVGRNSRSLMVVNNPDAADEPLRRILFLFTARERAAEFLDAWDDDELNQPQEVVEFGPRNLQQFGELIEGASEHCDVVTIDPDGRPLRLTPIAVFAENMRRIVDRIRRIFASGMDSVVLQKHQLGTVEVMSLYCHDGKYAAMKSPGGHIYYGKSREEAVTELQRSEFPAPPAS